MWEAWQEGGWPNYLILLATMVAFPAALTALVLSFQKRGFTVAVVAAALTVLVFGLGVFGEYMNLAVVDAAVSAVSVAPSQKAAIASFGVLEAHQCTLFAAMFGALPGVLTVVAGSLSAKTRTHAIVLAAVVVLAAGGAVAMWLRPMPPTCGMGDGAAPCPPHSEAEWTLVDAHHQLTKYKDKFGSNASRLADTCELVIEHVHDAPKHEHFDAIAKACTAAIAARVEERLTAGDVGLYPSGAKRKGPKELVADLEKSSIVKGDDVAKLEALKKRVAAPR